MNDANNIETAFSLLFEYQTAMKLNSARLLDLAEDLHRFIDASPHRPPQSASLIDFLGGARECTTSRIIERIFNYKEDGHFILLESFINTFISDNIKVESPIIDAETARFDISILDRKYALIIENKLKNAPFQRNQLARYVKKLSLHYKEREIFIIILPQYLNTRIRESAKRLPSDWEKKNDERKCSIDKFECWCDRNEKLLSDEQREWCSLCDKGIVNRLEDRFIILHDNFAEWLLNEADGLPNQEWPMKAFMMQFADYLKGLYSTRLNEKIQMAIQEFLRSKILNGENAQENWNILNETISELEQLKSSVERLKEDVCNDMVKEWENVLRLEYPNIQNDMNGNVYSFGINVQDIWIGCWSGAGEDNENQPYWGFWCAQKPTKKQVKMVKSILDKCGYQHEINSEEEEAYLVWDNTFNGVIECRNLYEAAKELGYL